MIGAPENQYGQQPLSGRRKERTDGTDEGWRVSASIRGNLTDEDAKKHIP